MKKLTPIIGLETHIELSTKTKMFCRCSANYFASEPNTAVCPVCLGLPGAMPIANETAIQWTIMLGIALNCSINRNTFFERKHYFYPDLPKGYQISQYQSPFCEHGAITLPRSGVTVQIRRIHLEEDTGKLLHENAENMSLIDFNRSGVPLVEVVTEPTIQDSSVAAEYLQTLQKVVQYLAISDADMEKGSMRCEPNISLRNTSTTKLPNYKVEVKNINSFKFVKRSIDFELKRQSQILQNNTIPQQETRRYIESNGTTASMRQKEEAHDYRYMPEPDIPPIILSNTQLSTIEDSVHALELPDQRFKRFLTLQVKKDDAALLVEQKISGDFLLQLVALCSDEEKKIGFVQKLANALINKKISSSLDPKEFYAAAKKLNTQTSTDMDVVHNTIAQAIKENPMSVANYKSGNMSAINSLIGHVMRQGRGSLSPQIVRTELEKALQ